MIRKIQKIRIIIFLIYRKFILRSLVNIKLGRIYYNNDGGFISNVVGRFVWRRDVKSSKFNGLLIKKNNLSDQLKKEGLVFYDELIDSDLVDSISDQWNIYCNNHPFPSDYRLQLSSENELSYIKSSFPLIDKILTEELLEVIQQYYKSYVNLLNIHIYRITSPDDKMLENAYGQTVNFHTDGSTSESLKIFILLNDTSEIDGPMNLINTENTASILKNTKINLDVSVRNEFIERNHHTVKFIGEKGRVLIARTNDCLHRATTPLSGRTRDIMTLYVTTSGVSRSKSELFSNCTYEQFYGPRRVLLK
jgi:hypothetical protein